MLERAGALAPWETNILQALGAAYAAKNQTSEAIRVFRDATERDPEDATAFSNLAPMRSSRAGDKTGAEKAFPPRPYVCSRNCRSLRDNLLKDRQITIVKWKLKSQLNLASISPVFNNLSPNYPKFY